MKRVTLNCGYVPLVDSAPLILARELKFAAEEGINLNLLRQPSWSALRDLLALGHLDAAHILSPLPIAMSLGLGAMPAMVDALMVLSVNGNVVGVSTEMAAKMRAAGWSGEFQAPFETREKLIAVAGQRLRIGVPFHFSMHCQLVRYWLDPLAKEAGVTLDIRVVPPPMMAEAIAENEIDAFCVGEPWGSMAVENRVGELILPGAAIWSFAPEKVLGARREWVEGNPELTAALMRAVYRAAAWLGDSENVHLATEILARSEHLDLPDHVIDRALAGRLITRPFALGVPVDRFLRFFKGGATFPWRSQAAWIADSMARHNGLDPMRAIEVGRGTFRSDLYRQNLAGLGAVMPVASEKLEGALRAPTPVSATQGEMILGPDAFFDGKIFDPWGEMSVKK